MGLFDGKVVVITGAGGGLGRAYAHAFAREGAKVVVNDLGGARDGTGSGHALADKVVAEIEAMGGEAAPNYDSVASRDGAERLIATAQDRFGRLDVLVNNAGILRDKTLLKMTDDMWALVLQVHLTGTYLCSQTAARLLLEQGEGGRIISTSSIAGLKGNFGQTNYASAKAGIAGFTRAAALELGRKGITVNAIGPVAKTRMTDDISVVPDDAKPELVAPMVLFLASDLAADVNGRIFGVHGNHIFEYQMEMTDGVDKGEEIWTPAEIHERFDEICKSHADRVKEKMAAQAKAGPAAVDPADKALAVFQAMTTAFLPDKAGDWEANLHFDIKDVGPFSMKVGGGEISVEPGLSGDPTCVIKLDGDTFFGMTQGKVDGTQAFMQGKITATNMRDLMKYSTAFDEKKARTAVIQAIEQIEAAGGGAPAEADPITKALAVFEAMSEAFLSEKVGDWAANLLFDIGDVGKVTLKVSGGNLTVNEGAEGDPTCVIKLDGDTFFGMTQGKVDGTQAFMQGKITATNMGDLMKYSTAFDQKKAQKAVKDALASLGPGAAKPAAAAAEAAEAPVEAKPEGLNKSLLGKTYQLPAWFVTPTQTIAYAEATNDDNPRFLDTEREGGIEAPPLFPVRLFHGLQEACLLDPELNADVTMLLYGEQDMRFHAPVRPGDLLHRKAVITEFEEKESGEVMAFAQSLYRGDELVTETTSRFFVRRRGGPKRKKGPKPEPPPLPKLAFSEDMTAREDQTYDYADASGDHNPIHVDNAIAKAAGLPGIILHGLCTMAFSSQAFVRQACDRDPGRLKRLKVRFSKPVHPGETVTTQAWVEDESESLIRYGFQMVTQDGRLVVTNGVAEVGRS